jgi:hypothetical protein
MLKSYTKYLFLSALILSAAVGISAQSDSGVLPASGRPESKDDQPRNFKEMLSKQRVEREKKDHEELLKRGDEAAQLTEQLENAFEQTNTLTSKDKQKLETLEKIVVKIRKELGGDDDDGEETVEVKQKPSTLQEAFNSLKSTTFKLVDELKKGSRFTVSALAIQSSNNVLKLVRFLRLRK